MNEPNQNFQINIVQGATVMKTITYINPDGDVVNLTGYTARMMFRTTVQDTGTPIITLSTSDNSIIINGSNGNVSFVISSTITAALSDGQLMYYNLFLYSPTGIVTPLLSGSAIVEGSTIR